jgi:hypothetical protein
MEVLLPEDAQPPNHRDIAAPIATPASAAATPIETVSTTVRTTLRPPTIAPPTPRATSSNRVTVAETTRPCGTGSKENGTRQCLVFARRRARTLTFAARRQSEILYPKLAALVILRPFALIPIFWSWYEVLLLLKHPLLRAIVVSSPDSQPTGASATLPL